MERIFEIGNFLLFNACEIFTPILHNNLKEPIVNLEKDNEAKEIWCSIEVDKPLIGMNIDNISLKLFGSFTVGKLIV